jgi:hypothetical protein
LPTVRLVAASDEVPHATDVSAAQLPEKSWMRGLAGAEDNVIVVLEDTATKLYHTSFRLATPQPIGEIVV